MTVGQIFTKICNFIENRQIFMLLNCNCTKLSNFEDFKTSLGEPFFRGHSVECHGVHLNAQQSQGIACTSLCLQHLV